MTVTTKAGREAPGGRADSGGQSGKILLTVFLPFACGYFLSYLFRNVNAVIAPHLIADLNLQAGDLGLLTAAYFLAFAAFQMPLGLVLDRYGPRKVQVALLLVAALGALLFGLSQSQGLLILGRALIGFGVSGCLMSAFKAITLWFERDRWPLVNGCFVASGGLGAIVATRPVEMLLGLTDWRGLFYGLAAASLAVALLILLAVPERRDAARPSRLGQALREIGHIYRDPFFWRIAPLGMAVTGTSMAILGLWGGPWLKDVARMAPTDMANTLAVGATAMALGSVLTGLLADRAGRRGISLEAVIGWGVPFSFLAQTVIAFALWSNSVLPWLLLGLAMNFTILVYARLSQHFPVAYAGRANTLFNMLVFLAAFGIQSGMGWVIDLVTAAQPQAGGDLAGAGPAGGGPAGGYPEAAYLAAFGTALGLQLAAYLWFLTGRRPAPGSVLRR